MARSVLSESHPTLTWMFEQQGYTTGAVIANPSYLDSRWQLDRGFETYDCEWGYGDMVNERVFRWLDDAAEQPFFLFVNYMDTHTPYNTDPRLGLLPEPPDSNAELSHLLRKRLAASTGPVPRFLSRKVIDQYDTGIVNVDDYIGRLLDYLDEQGALENTVVVITSDHGEGFGEHRIVSHGIDVYEPEVWIPLIVKGPGQTLPERVQQLVGTSDVPSLILEHLPSRMATKYSGAFPNAPGNHPIVCENYWPPKGRSDRVRAAVYEWPYKFIHSSDGEHELYQLANDPAELRNLINKHPGRARSLAVLLNDYRKQRGVFSNFVEPPPPSQDQLKQLRALGYLGN